MSRASRRTLDLKQALERFIRDQLAPRRDVPGAETFLENATVFRDLLDSAWRAMRTAEVLADPVKARAEHWDDTLPECQQEHCRFDSVCARARLAGPA